jgi:hypothetical protein
LLFRCPVTFSITFAERDQTRRDTPAHHRGAEDLADRKNLLQELNGLNLFGPCGSNRQRDSRGLGNFSLAKGVQKKWLTTFGAELSIIHFKVFLLEKPIQYKI